MSQIEALRKEARLYIASNKGSGAGALSGDGAAGSAAGPGGSGEHGAEGSPQAQVEALKKALNEAKENEVRKHLQDLGRACLLKTPIGTAEQGPQLKYGSCIVVAERDVFLLAFH
jgi:hypothetical protein